MKLRLEKELTYNQRFHMSEFSLPPPHSIYPGKGIATKFCREAFMPLCKVELAQGYPQMRQMIPI